MILPHTFDDTQPVGGQDLQDALDAISLELPVQSLPVFGTNARGTFHGQFSVSFSLAAGVGATSVVDLEFTLPSMFMPFGAPNYTGAVSWQDTITWAYKAAAGDTTIEIALHNNGAGVATGTFYFFVFAVG